MSTVIQSPVSNTSLAIPAAVIAAGADATAAFVRGELRAVELAVESAGMIFTIPADVVAAGADAVRDDIARRATEQYQLSESIAKAVVQDCLAAHLVWLEALATITPAIAAEFTAPPPADPAPPETTKPAVTRRAAASSTSAE